MKQLYNVSLAHKGFQNPHRAVWNALFHAQTMNLNFTTETKSFVLILNDTSLMHR